MGRTRTASAIGLILVVFLLAACQSVAAPTPAPLTEEEAAQSMENASIILNTTWTVQSFGGLEEPIPGVDGTFPSIDFMAARYIGFSGCNYFTGSYRVEGANVWLDPPATTSAVCEDEALATQESAFLTILVTARSFEFDRETLSLSAEGRQLMTLEALEAAPFEGTAWNYRFFQGQLPSWQPALPGVAVTILFEGDTVSGSAGCNNYAGAFTRNGDEISVSDIALTRKMCTEPADVMAQEERFIASLQTAVAIRQAARSFQLVDAERPIMLFNAD